MLKNRWQCVHYEPSGFLPGFLVLIVVVVVGDVRWTETARLRKGGRASRCLP